MIRLILLSVILVLAGIVHLMDPYSFANAIPPFLPYKLEIIYLTGVLEFILAAGLIWKKTREMSAKLTALYFVILIPVHIYVSVYSIPMFGVSEPAILWGRTLFQLVFIAWAWSLRKV